MNRYTTNTNVKKYKEIIDLSNFTPLKSYRLFLIDQATDFTEIEGLIYEAEKTKRFTLFLYDNKLLKKMFIEIEFVQQSKSIIITFEVFRARNFLFHRIDQLFAIIYNSSNTIHVWGDSTQWLYYKDYAYFFYMYINKIRLLNTQEDFKLWYNQTFPHHENCDQILDFHDVDGPLCSCSHRPYKCLQDAWSLHLAITYTFHENLSTKNTHTPHCLAITKLATIVQQKWTHQQINDYIREHSVNHQPTKDINRFDDIFHQHDDDIDEDDYLDFDNFYQDFHTRADEDDELLKISAAYDDKNTEEEKQQRQLSQRLSQLKTTTDENIDTESTITMVPATTSKKRSSITPATSNYQMATKKPKTNDNETEYNDDDDGDADLPRFLSRTKDIFQETMKPLLDKLSKPIDIEVLRTMALYKFRIAVDDLNTFLWTAYLHSGQGKLQISKQPTTTTTLKLFVWPATVKELIKKTRYRSDDINIVNNSTFEDFVRAMLRDFAGHNRSRSNEIKTQKQILANSFTLEMEEAIDKFVEQHGTAFHRVDTEEQISIVKYEYEDRFIDLEFYHQNPNYEQVNVFRNISERKYEKETAKMSVAILKQHLLYNHLPDSFETIHLPEPVSLETIQNNTIRQRLTEQYNKILQRTKADMFTMYIATEQAKADECVKEFDRDYAEMKEIQSTGSLHKRLTPIMLQLLRKRLANINQHLIHLFNLRTRFFDKAPTVKN
ncbi:unnamed protein product [Adineta steineri]|uniref:Uncharacterized protein n=1 Tax=Adineta steineri TaxID=433720 RepID=A0A815RV26_9BILA|nr:unnamed protein product [Adineta steineri]